MTRGGPQLEWRFAHVAQMRGRGAASAVSAMVASDTRRRVGVSQLHIYYPEGPNREDEEWVVVSSEVPDSVQCAKTGQIFKQKGQGTLVKQFNRTASTASNSQAGGDELTTPSHTATLTVFEAYLTQGMHSMLVLSKPCSNSQLDQVPVEQIAGYHVFDLWT